MKYRVYVCTAAPDRAYAKMVWKQLDPDHILIPKDKIEERLFNGHSLERLDRVAGLGTYGTQPGYPTPDDGMPSPKVCQRSKHLPSLPVALAFVEALQAGDILKKALDSIKWQLASLHIDCLACVLWMAACQ